MKIKFLCENDLSYSSTLCEDITETPIYKIHLFMKILARISQFTLF